VFSAQLRTDFSINESGLTGRDITAFPKNQYKDGAMQDDSASASSVQSLTDVAQELVSMSNLITKFREYLYSLLKLLFEQVNKDFPGLMFPKLVALLEHKKHIMGQLISLLPI
jgi:hypothetical protein